MDNFNSFTSTAAARSSKKLGRAKRATFFTKGLKEFIVPRKAISLMLLLACPVFAWTQIGVGTTVPHPSSMLHIAPGAGNNKGLIMPMITSANRVVLDSTQNMAHGLMLFDTDLQKFYYFHESPKQWFELDHDWIRKDVAGGAPVVGNHIYSGVPGNVGIGTSSIVNPASKLTVVGNASFGSAAYTQDSVAAGSGVTIGTWLGVGTRTRTGSDIFNVKGNSKMQGNLTVTGTVTASQIVGGGTVPAGGVMMYSGTTAGRFGANGLGVTGTPYEGWALCDGRNGTPDLRGRFVPGVGNGLAANGNGESNQYQALGTVGGESTHLISLAEMPLHNHTMNHTHSITDPGHTHGVYANSTTGSNGGLDDETNAGAYWAKISSNTTGITVDSYSGTTGNRGGTTPTENRPPFYALYYIQRL